MAHDFTPKWFLRHTPNDLLKLYFERHGALGRLAWDSLKETDVDPIYEAWQQLDDAVRREVENDFQQMHDLATADGIRVIIEEGLFHQKELAAELDARDGYHNKVMWVFLNEPRIFEVASKMDWADHLDGRYRRKRKGMPKKQPDLSPGARLALCLAVSAYFWSNQGRGRNCKMDLFHRGGRYHYFFIYPEDYASTFIGYDDSGQFVRHPQKPAFEVVFVYDPVDGTLSLYVRGDKKVKQDLQAIFAETILHESIGPENRASTPYDLSGLKNRNFSFATEPSDGIAEIRVKNLRLSIKGNRGRKITLEGNTKQNKRDVYDLIDQALDQERLPLTNVDPEHATIQVEFSPINPDAKSVTFGISPNSCNLKERPEHLVVADCLKRSGIARV